MFDEILGLPAHPLVIHAAVVFVPLLALIGAAYAVLPRHRARLGWAVVLLAVVAPVSALASWLSGRALLDGRFGGRIPPGVVGERIAEHESLATPLLISTAALGVAALLLVAVARKAGPAPDAATGGRRRAAAGSAGNTTVTTVLAGVTIVLAVVAVYFVVRTGHTGALAVWG